MILIINVCSQKLSEYEFVKPIENLLSKNGFATHVKHFSETFDASKYDRIIICGTALKDFEYMDSIGKFSWIRNYNGKLLGICAGTQIIASAFGMKLKEKTIIGNKEVNVVKNNSLIKERFNAYFLISKQPSLNKDFISLTKDESVIKHKNKEIYGCMFHPEVLNSDMLINFCKFM
jgi:GMP synthase-like glutamine amidotransferase